MNVATDSKELSYWRMPHSSPLSFAAQAAIIAIVGFVESIAVAKTIAARHGEVPIHPSLPSVSGEGSARSAISDLSAHLLQELAADSELIGLGIANLLSAISGGRVAPPHGPAQPVVTDEPLCDNSLFYFTGHPFLPLP